ncbi:unnamed protein product [Discosporangium mesarthrocarpum]
MPRTIQQKKARSSSEDEDDVDSASEDAVTHPSASDSESESDDQGEGMDLFPGGRKDGASADKTARKNIRSSAIKEKSIHDEELAHFRRRMGIRVKGSQVPEPMERFADMPSRGDEKEGGHTRRVLLENIEASAWKEPTPIQMQAVPILLEGRDLLATAPTGSGKTAAFVLPITLRLGSQPRSPGEKGVRAVLLAPTRELAAQIHRDVVHLTRGRKLRTSLLTKAVASKGAGADSKSVLAGCDLVVSTPMRLVALLRGGSISLSSVTMVVLDEADKLFDTGGGQEDGDKAFIAQVDEVLHACSNTRVQRAMFSATMGDHVKELAQTILRNPVHLTVGTANAGASTIEQRLMYVGMEEGKLLAMRQLVQEGLRPPVLVFLQSKDRAKELFHELVYDGINVDVMHAGRTQEQRDRIIQRFRTGEIWVLICTDLMSRGIDFKGVNMVVNYDFPQSAVSYIHRIGRTGRAGRKGIAVTLFTDEDMDSLRSIANVIRLSGCKVPDWMLSMKKLRGKDRRKREAGAPQKRPRISTVSAYDKKRAHKRQQMVQHTQRRVKKLGRHDMEYIT